jgi:hypothetical protein
MVDQPAESLVGPDLSRRDFLARGLGRRLAGLVGSGLVAVPVAAIGAVPRAPEAAISARDLTRMSRDEVRRTLDRVRARRGRR